MISATYGNEDGRYGKILCSSQEKNGKYFCGKRMCMDVVRKYSVLRELRFFTLLLFCCFRVAQWIRNVDELPDPWHLLPPWNRLIVQSVRLKWRTISGEIEKWQKRGLLYYYSIIHSSIFRSSLLKLIPILNNFLGSVANGSAYCFSLICFKASWAVPSNLNSIT